MLDLNLSFAHQDMRTAVRGEVEDSGTSNSSVVNAEGCSSGNIGDDDSVSGAGDHNSFHCFSFDILNVGDTGALTSNSNDEDRKSQSQALTRSEFVTRTLFQSRHEEGRFNPKHQVDLMFLLPNNNELQEMRLVNGQQIKPTVQQNQIRKKSRRGPRSRSSQYRGVTFYRRTGRWESHIWDCGKQVYLGGFDTAHAAARAYDRAAIKFRGVDADINFNISDYEDDMNQIKDLSKEEFVHMLRRHNNGFSRGGSKYRGVTMNNCGPWEARMGPFHGKKVFDNAAAIKSSEVETVTSHFERDTGNSHNLDLNLRISTPSCLGKKNENLEHMQLNHGLHDIRSLQVKPFQTIFLTKKLTNSSAASSSRGQSQTPAMFFTAASSGFPTPAAPNFQNYNNQPSPLQLLSPPWPPPPPPMS